MAGTIKGITVEIGASTTGLSKALDDVNKRSRSVQTELKQVETLLKLNPHNVELVTQKQLLLAKAVETAKEKLDTLRTAQAQVEQQFANGKITDEQYRAFGREVAKAEGELNKLETELKETGGAAEKTDKKINEVGDGAVTAGKQFDIAAEKTHGFGKALASIAGGIGKAAATALTAVAAATVAAGVGLAKITVNAGKAADELITLSNKTGISTKTLQEMAYAARFVDVPLETMTDSMFKLTKSMDGARSGTGAQSEAFNTLGISVKNTDGSLRDSKQVWLETIDALGKVANETDRDALAMQLFGKNAKELNPLIVAGSDALIKLAAEANNAGVVLSDAAIKGLGEFDDKMERLKATGGALASVLGAAVAPALGVLVDNLREVATAVSGAISTGDWGGVGDSIAGMLQGMAKGISEALPTLAAEARKILSAVAGALIEGLPSIVPALVGAAASVLESVLASIADNASALAGMVVTVVMQIVGFILNALPVVLSAGIEILIALANGVAQAIPQLLPTIVGVVTQLIQIIIQNLPLIVQAGMGLLLALVQGIVGSLPVLIGAIIAMIPMLVQAVMECLPQILDAGAQILLAIMGGIVTSLPTLLQAILDIFPMVVQTITDSLPQIIDSGVQVQASLIDGIVKSIPQLLTCIVEMIPKIVKAIVDNLPKIIDAGIKVTLAIVLGLVDAIPELISCIVGMIPIIVKAIIDNLPAIISAGVQVVGSLVVGLVKAAGTLIGAAGDLAWNFLKGIWAGIQDGASWLFNKMKSFFTDVVNNVKDVLGIHSPSTVFAGIGKNLLQGMANGILGGISLVDGALDKLNAVVGGVKTDLSVNAGFSGAQGAAGNIVTLNVTANTLDEGQINRLVNVVNRKLGLAY